MDLKTKTLTRESVKCPASFIIHTCETCSKVFPNKSELNRHNLIHTGRKDWICDHCKRAFIRKDHLKVHLWKLHHEMMK